MGPTKNAPKTLAMGSVLTAMRMLEIPPTRNSARSQMRQSPSNPRARQDSANGASSRKPRAKRLHAVKSGFTP